MFLLAAAVVCVSCSWEEESEYSKKMKAYCQTHSEQEDSVFTDNDADSTWVFSSSSVGQMSSTSAFIGNDAGDGHPIYGWTRVKGTYSYDDDSVICTCENTVYRFSYDKRNGILILFLDDNGTPTKVHLEKVSACYY